MPKYRKFSNASACNKNSVNLKKKNSKNRNEMLNSSIFAGSAVQKFSPSPLWEQISRQPNKSTSTFKNVIQMSDFPIEYFHIPLLLRKCRRSMSYIRQICNIQFKKANYVEKS